MHYSGRIMGRATRQLLHDCISSLYHLHFTCSSSYHPHLFISSFFVISYTHILIIRWGRLPCHIQQNCTSSSFPSISSHHSSILVSCILKPSRWPKLILIIFIANISSSYRGWLIISRPPVHDRIYNWAITHSPFPHSPCPCSRKFCTPQLHNASLFTSCFAFL